jgi:choloylglycine hydrolase
MKKLFYLVVGIASFFVTTNIEACTGIKLVAKDGNIVTGRTLEFGVQVDTSIAVVPRGYKFTGTTPNGDGLTYTTKYASVGAIAYGHPQIMDGMNEKGLVVGTFYFPGFAGYSEINKENQAKALSPVDFPNWLLTQFATLEEVKAALPSVVIAPTVVKEWGPTPAPFHYIVYDKKGNALVIEPVDGAFTTYENNDLGVFTNSPTFDWHMTNLRNFINLTPFNVKPLDIRGLILAPFGQGSGMVGLSGDFTPPSRFVRAAIYSVTAVPSKDANEAVFQAFHILNQFDIPVGVAREVINGVTYSDYTLVTSVKDPQSLKYYFKTYEDQNLKVVDLSKFDLNAKDLLTAKTASAQKAQDISSQLK